MGSITPAEAASRVSSRGCVRRVVRTQPSHRNVGAPGSHTSFPTAHPGKPGSPPCTPAVHTLFTVWYTRRLTGRARSITPSTRAALAHVPRVHGPQLARALAPALTPPRFPSPLVFLETLLSVPLPPRPEALAVFLASLVSAPFPLGLPARDLPPLRPAGDPGRPLPHRHSRGDSRPSPEPRIFPLATWGAGRSPALNFLQGWDAGGLDGAGEGDGRWELDS